MIPFHDILKELEYDTSPYYFTEEHSFAPETVHMFRAARSAGVRGIYVFQTSPDSEPKVLHPRPVVYIAEAKHEAEARAIHCKLWNLYYVPFLIITLPHQVRVYTGFTYSEESESDGLLGYVEYTDHVRTVKNLLKDFTASAIDTGAIWQSSYAQALKPNQRVDKRLLQHLNMLGQELKKHGLGDEVAHALIGKYVYFSYLRDRHILSDEWLQTNNIDPEDVFSMHATKSGVQRLVEVLENRFNGKIFPLDFAQADLQDRHVAWVASVFSGAEISGSSSDMPSDMPDVVCQLHLPFKAYSFEYIPVETLSSIYEQFIYERKQKGAIYTPEMLADYLLSEMESVKPLQRGMKILDPACGSGIFLVLAYRRLIEKEKRRLQRDLEPEELRTLLLESIYGVERERDACYITEFSLILTLMNYIENRDLQNLPFLFPALHNQHIFACDFFDFDGEGQTTQGGFWQQNMSFDWVVGNPPWITITLKPCTKGEEHACAWMQQPQNKKERPISRNRVAEAFSWLVGDVLEPEGVVGFVLSATSLFSLGKQSQKYRQHFFTNHEVLRITNFTNLREVLFGGRAEMPATTIIYRKAVEDYEKQPIIHYAPFTVNQVSHTTYQPWTITIHENEMQTIFAYEAEEGENSTWKLALWGTYRDRRTIERINYLFPTTLEQMCVKRGWSFERNVELRHESESKSVDLEYIAELRGKKLFRSDLMNKALLQHTVPKGILKDIPNEKCFVRKRGGQAGLSVIYAPHIIVSSRWMSYIIYSEEDFVIAPLHIGIASTDKDAHVLRALSIYLQSRLVAYYLFFHSSAWGVFRRNRQVSINEVANIPVPDFTAEQIQTLVALHEEIVQTEYQSISDFVTQLHQKRDDTFTFEHVQETNHAHELALPSDLTPSEKQSVDTFLRHVRGEIQERIDRCIFDMFGIPHTIRCLVNEFVQIRLLLDKRATLSLALREPTRQELVAYARKLRDELDSFLMGTAHHTITITQSQDLIVCQVEITKHTEPFPIDETNIKTGNSTLSSLLSELDDTLKKQVSQWVYVRRGLRLFDGPRVFLYKLPRIIDWTQTQAMNDASEIIGQSVMAAKEHYDNN